MKNPRPKLKVIETPLKTFNNNNRTNAILLEKNTSNFKEKTIENYNTFNKINRNINNITRPLTGKNQKFPVKINTIKNIEEESKLPTVNDNKIETNFDSANNNENLNTLSPEKSDLQLETNENNTESPLRKTVSFNKRPKTAQDKFRLTMRNINHMFNKTSKLLRSPLTRQKYVYKGTVLAPIPHSQIERLNLLYSIFNNPKFVEHFEKAPSVLQNGIEKIGNYLNEWSGRYYELEKYAMFFYYLCNKIRYDIRGDNKEVSDLDVILKSGKANSEQFCRLFEYLCKSHNLKFKHIKGFCKHKVLPFFTPHTDVSVPNHCWNAINFQSQWYLCDLTFGSGGIKKRREDRTDYFNPYYFLTVSENLIDSHLPYDDLWQLTKKIIPPNQFNYFRPIHLPAFYKNVYEKQVKLVTHEYPIIYSSKNLVVKIGVKDMTIMANLFYSNFKVKVSEIKFNFNDKRSEFTLEPIFPGNGEYWIQILYREFSANEPNYYPLINYKVIVDDSQERYIEEFRRRREMEAKKEALINEIKKNRPKSLKLPKMGAVIEREKAFSKRGKNICLDNENAHIIIPNQNNLKIGVENEIMLKVPNSEAIVVLDGHNFNYLKRKKKDKNIWEGKILIHSENISILSKKNQHIFTEVFHLKAHYTSSTLLRQSQRRVRLASDNGKGGELKK